VFPDMKYPAFCKQYLEYKTISEQYISLKKDFESWKKQIDEDVRDESLPADRTINLFFEAVSLLKCDSFIESAYSRYKVGNPPGKDNKYGDAINWECLLDNIPEGEDLFFISADKDYRSTLFKDEFHPFLRKEWELRKKSKIHFYTALVPFLNEHIESIKLDTENKKMNLIQQLSESGNFVTTHGIIKMMTRYSDWTDTQVEELCEIANKNFMMCIRSSMKQYLENRSKEFSFEGCVLFYSMWEGYKKQENMKEFLKFMEEKGVKTISLHTSGHADEKDFDKLIKKVEPKIIIPVHTENSEWFKRYEKCKVIYDKNIIKI